MVVPFVGAANQEDRLDVATQTAATALTGSASVGNDPAVTEATTSATTTLPDIPIRDASTIPAAPTVVPPTSVSIPRLGVQARVRPTGVQADSQMALPDNPGVLGWYRFGAAPGDKRGSAVVAAHVDASGYGVGPLAAMTRAEPGMIVDVRMRDGDRLRYRTTSVEQIGKQSLQADELFRPGGRHVLRIVTCGGAYLPDLGAYEDNIVVTAVLVQ